MRTILKLLILAGVGGFIAAACSSSDSRVADTGTGGGSAVGGSGAGVGGIGGAGCQRMEYLHPGCGADAVAVCTNGTGGACAGPPACGCDGRVLSGCYIFSEPFAYMFTPNFSLDAGNTCDPTADAGR